MEHFQIHFGVNSGAMRFALENQAVNEATFRCPDELGWKPQVAFLYIWLILLSTPTNLVTVFNQLHCSRAAGPYCAI
jgi:hypothetical protein